MKRKYFNSYDFYNMENDEEITILKNFKPIKGNIKDACGPYAVLMCLNYLGDYTYKIEEIYRLVKCEVKNGTKLNNIITFLRNNDYKILTNLDMYKNKDGKIFPDFSSFRDFILYNLNQNNPIIVESVYFGGHYQVIIGYDKRSNKDNEDILILADSLDICDEVEDGYVFINALLFYNMWFDDGYLLKEERMEPFIVIMGKK